jgi:hypothetical protein
LFNGTLAMSNCSDPSTAGARPVVGEAEARLRLLESLKVEWDSITDTLVWLGNQLSQSAANFGSDRDVIILLQTFDVLHQQIRSLADFTLACVRAPGERPESNGGCADQLSAIPFADMRFRLSGSAAVAPETSAGAGSAAESAEWF